ncbi:MAG: Holliday junction resolvase-like protein [Candidatus Thorarchaeota archaeon]|jgi:predicted Holliday junction resolvase-like endonuclease
MSAQIRQNEQPAEKTPWRLKSFESLRYVLCVDEGDGGLLLEYVLIGVVVGIIVAIVVYYVLNERLQHYIKLFDSQEAMMKERYEKEWVIREKKLRVEIADKQRPSLKGKLAEQIISLLKGDIFPYNPADARFLGAPVDYIIFDGYTSVKDEKSSDDITIIIADVKTGGGKLSTEQRRIKEAVDEKRVKWRTIEIPEL